MTGTLSGKLITCIPGVDAIDATKPMPSLATIVSKRWYSVAINVGDPPFHVRPNWGGFIPFPFIMAKPMTFELQFFAPWNETYDPDPIKSYA